MRPTLPGLLLACLAATMPPGCRNQPGQNSQAAGGATPARGQRAAAGESNPSKPHPAGPHRTPAAAGSRSRQLSKVAPPKPHPKAPAGPAPKTERVQRRQTAQQSAAALRAGTERPPGTKQQVGTEQQAGGEQQVAAEHERGAAGEGEAAGRDSNALARLLLLTPEGPLLVELEITVDGRPFRTARQKLIDHLMRAADADGNGRVFWDELFDNTWQALGRAPEAVLLGMSRKDFLRSYDLNQNRQVDADEAERLVARVDDAGSAFSVSGTTRFRGSNLYQSAVRALADANSDGLLSATEMEMLPARLMSRDANDDGLVALDELASPGSLLAAADDEGHPPAAFDCTPQGRFDSIYYQLAEMVEAAGGLPAEAFGSFPELHAALDKDASGLVTQDELQGLAEAAAPLVVACRFSEASPALELAEATALRRAGATIQTPSLQVLVRTSTLQVRFLLDDAPLGYDPTQQVEGVMALIDTDRNGYLTAEELRVRPGGLPEFKVLDRDGDERLYPKELRAYYEMAVAPLLTGVHVTAADDRDALFALIDSNGDGRLGAAELAHCVSVLQSLDQDGDTAVDASEIPATITATFSRGRGTARSRPPLAVLPGRPPAPARTPSWFLHMDFNRDGVVTPREFLGTPEQFSQLDVDGDRAISESEANRLDAGP